MKKINLFAVVGIVLAVILAVVLVFSFAGKKEEQTALNVFKLDTVSQVEEYAKEHELTYYADFDGVVSLSSSLVLGKEAEIDFYYSDDSVYKSEAEITLFEAEGEDIASYTLTEKDKANIEKSITELTVSFGEKLGCIFEQYSVVNNFEGVTYDNDTDAFFDSLITREYSVRDAGGTLWLLRASAFNNHACAVLTCITDETGYEGFIPSIDLSAEEE